MGGRHSCLQGNAQEEGNEGQRETKENVLS